MASSEVAVTVSQFGGLNLAANPLQLWSAGAVDLKNVDPDPVGLRVRPGRTLITANGANAYLLGTVSFNGGLAQILAVTTSTIYALSSTGTLIASQATASAKGFVKFGTGSDDAVYFSTNSGLYKLTSAGTFTLAVTDSLAKGVYSAVTPWDTRMVVGPTDTGLHRSRIAFSDAGDPTTWGVDNWIDLAPGDGDSIAGLVAWRDLLFVFKGASIFAFYGTSVESDGSPVFDYRQISTDKGLFNHNFATGTLAVAAPDAVYFAAYDGIYRTTGEEPVKISQAIDPWWRRLDTPNAGLLATAINYLNLSYAKGKLYLALTANGTTASMTLVYTIADHTWTLYDFGITAAVDAAADFSSDDIVIAKPNPSGGLYYHGDSSADDDGTAIAWSYTSGYGNLGHNSRKNLRRVSVWGSAAEAVSHKTLAVGARGTSVASATQSLTLTASPAIGVGDHEQSVEGVMFAHQLSGSAASQTAIHGVTYWMDKASMENV